jgi:hypothetical protein
VEAVSSFQTPEYVERLAQKSFNIFLPKSLTHATLSILSAKNEGSSPDGTHRGAFEISSGWDRTHGTAGPVTRPCAGLPSPPALRIHVCGVEPTAGPYFCGQLPDIVKWICFRGMKGREPSIEMHGGPEKKHEVHTLHR